MNLRKAGFSTGTIVDKVRTQSVIELIKQALKELNVSYNDTCCGQINNGYNAVPEFVGISNSASLPLAGVTTLSTFGDSFTTGYNAQDFSKIWPIQLSNLYGLTLNNQSENAAGWYTTVRNIFLQNYLSSTRNDLVATLTGPIDITGNAGTQLNQNKVAGSVRTSLGNLFLKSAVPFSDPSVTKSGFSNGTVACQNKATVLGGSIVTSTTSGATLTFNFTGTDLLIGTFATSTGNTEGAFNIVIDGVTGYGSSYWRQYNGSQTFANTGNYALANEAGLTIYPDSILIRGLDAGTHSCVITNTSTTVVYLDYFGVLDTPANVKPVVIASIPYTDENTYPGYSIPTPATHSATDAVNYAMRDAILEFYDYPVSFFDMNNYYFPYNMVQRPDNLHPKTIGQNAFFAGFQNAINVQRIEKI